jgi:hypothetical protein
MSQILPEIDGKTHDEESVNIMVYGVFRNIVTYAILPIIFAGKDGFEVH